MHELLNWNTFIRYKTIDEAIRHNTLYIGSKNKNPLDVNALINACNEAYQTHCIYRKSKGKQKEFVTVGRSQVLEDIKNLKQPEGFNAPINSRIYKGRSDYYYENGDYSIYKTHWYKQTALKYIEKSISIFQPELMPDGSVFIELYKEIVDQLSDFETNKRVVFRSNEPSPEWHAEFMTFYNAIINKEVLRIKYKSFHEEVFDFEFHPHIIKEFNRRYYAYGFNPSEGKEWSIPLDRVLNAKATSETYIPQVYINKNEDGSRRPEIWSEEDWSDYFGEMIGVTRFEDTELTRIVLRVNKPDYKYFESKPMIPDDKIVTLESSTDDYRDYVMYLYPNRELQDAIISYLPNIQVLEPRSLKEEIAKRLSSTTWI
jgi:predicted DNA-binding transcriptional regulator YafY